jgi:hypothetical protein
LTGGGYSRTRTGGTIPEDSRRLYRLIVTIPDIELEFLGSCHKVYKGPDAPAKKKTLSKGTPAILLTQSTVSSASNKAVFRLHVVAETKMLASRNDAIIATRSIEHILGRERLGNRRASDNARTILVDLILDVSAEH